jgi:hypothetical protein
MCRRAEREGALLSFKIRGGARPGAGRKPNGGRPGGPHARRARITGREPVHATAKLVRGLPRLRSKRVTLTLRGAPACPVTKARTRLLTTGWRRHGLLAPG